MGNPEIGLIYRSTFSPSSEGLSVLKNGKIISGNETPSQMIERIVLDLSSVENKFDTSLTEVMEFATVLGEQMDEAKIVFSTPIMTNAYQSHSRPLSACSVPPVDLKGDLSQVKKIIDTYHQEAMGTGFDLTNVDDPVKTLLFLNEVAVNGAESGREERPVGNMATCRINHPKILEFIEVKALRQDINWKFNISVDVPDSFWHAVENDKAWTLSNNEKIRAVDLLDAIATSAHACADPGIICLDRLNADNPTPNVGLYTSTAPCAEVGLIPGETCQFGYINLAKFIDKNTQTINYSELRKSAHLITRALDNALELSIERYAIQESATVMQMKRKIGVGICGLADMLAFLNIPYDSDPARELCRDVVSFINYETKIASFELAKIRGSFGAMNDLVGCRYNQNPGFIEEKYGNLKTNTVSNKQWLDLDSQIRSTRLLRNCSTIALPPTGRSGLVVGASTGIEPLFTLISNNEIHPALKTFLDENTIEHQDITSDIYQTGSCKNTQLQPEQKKIFETATEISPSGHLSMVAAIQPCVDESISKTINLPADTTIEGISQIYMQANKLGLKGMTVYRNGSSKLQPRKVTT